MNLKKLFKKVELSKEELLKQNKLLHKLLVICLFFITLVMIVIYWIMFSPLQPVSRCMMFYPKTVGQFPSGVYFDNDYYCVYVKDQSLNWVSYVDYHEVCHHMVYWDREHFCDNKLVNNISEYGFYDWMEMRDNYTKSLNKNNKLLNKLKIQLS